MTYSYPDENGKFGEFGGRFVSEILMPAVLELEEHYKKVKNDQSFWDEFNYYLKYYAGRPSPLYFAKKITKYCNGAKIYFKRDELNHTGSHKINNCIGQALMAKRMGKKRIIAETGAGQHGVATATICALLDLPCVIYMGAKDIERQKHNVFRMKLLGAKVVSVSSGSASLKNAINEALKDWASNSEDTYYLLGTVAGPHPYPVMIRDFHSVIGNEAKEQILEAEGRLPDALIACIGGGSNSIGLFYPFIDNKEVEIFGVEAGGLGVETGEHSASITAGSKAILHGNLTYFLQDDEGQILDAHSISAGLDYPGIGPEHAFLHSIGRVNYVSATDREALEAFKICSKMEGIIPALEPSHAVAFLLKQAPKMRKDQIIIINLCGRGDKDMATIFEMDEFADLNF